MSNTVEQNVFIRQISRKLLSHIIIDQYIDSHIELEKLLFENLSIEPLQLTYNSIYSLDDYLLKTTTTYIKQYNSQKYNNLRDKILRVICHQLKHNQSNILKAIMNISSVITCKSNSIIIDSCSLDDKQKSL